MPFPPFVGVLKPIERGFGGGFLGAKYDPFLAGDPSEKAYRVRDLAPPDGLTLDRVERRREILRDFNSAWRAVETDARLNSYQPALERAYSMVFNERVHNAFDIAKEPDKVRDALRPHADRAGAAAGAAPGGERGEGGERVDGRLGHAFQEFHVAQREAAAADGPGVRRTDRRPAPARACWRARWWCRRASSDARRR